MRSPFHLTARSSPSATRNRGSACIAVARCTRSRCRPQSSAASSLAFSADGTLLAGGFDTEIRLVTLATGDGAHSARSRGPDLVAAIPRRRPAGLDEPRSHGARMGHRDRHVARLARPHRRGDHGRHRRRSRDHDERRPCRAAVGHRFGVRPPSVRPRRGARIRRLHARPAKRSRSTPTAGSCATATTRRPVKPALRVWIGALTAR